MNSKKISFTCKSVECRAGCDDLLLIVVVVVLNVIVVRDEWIFVGRWG